MQHLVIFLLFFIILALTDIPSLVKRKAWNILYFSVPVYLLCLGLNIMMATEVKYPSITKILIGFLSKFIK